MVLMSRENDYVKLKLSNKYKIITTLIFGVISLAIPITIIIIDPIHAIVNYNLRLHVGSSLYNLLRNENKAAKLTIYVFNITNAEQFLSEEDQKIRVEEVGPFVYQEYHWYENVHESEDGKIMSLTSRYRSEFIREESIGYPQDVNLNMPNLPMLSATTALANYPSLVQHMYSALAAQLKSRSIVKLNVHDYFWGYKDPLVTLCNNLVPGLVYFNSLGLLARLYDNQTDYKLQVGATNQDRFLIKSVEKARHLPMGEIDNVEISKQTFVKDTYECVGYPPDLNPVPLKLYRVGICKTFEATYVGKRNMEYGGEGLVYTIGKENFKSELNPMIHKKYPDGLMDISTCYFGIPFAISYPHFINADPKLLKGVDGLNPNMTNLVNEIVIDRRVGFTVHTNLSLQLNMVLDDLSFNKDARRLSNIVIPIIRMEVEQPKMSSGVRMIYHLVYSIAPYILIVIEIILSITGLLLIGFVIRTLYFNWLFSTRKIILETQIEKKILCETLSEVPLIRDR